MTKPHIGRYYQGKRYGWAWGVWPSLAARRKQPSPMYHSLHKDAAMRNAKFAFEISAEGKKKP